ncbi:MAG: orotidine-5'-phosphate decarboxylase [Nitrospirae bacterium]|nr:orotidine-5'-phosphate decarboxylase [Nitrospirota bacterium]
MKEAEKAVSVLKDHVGLFKVGLELFVSAGPGIFRTIAKNSDRDIFLDLKFHDIPETVLSAVKAAAAYKVRFVTVHASEGKGLLKAVVDGIRNAAQVLAVTVLTSLSREDLRDVGMDERLNISDIVLQRARLAKAVGCAGVVCSGSEARGIKEQIGREMIVVVPGVRPDWASVPNDDQKRIVTPRQAILNGADYLVVGRPIKKAKDPVLAADKIVEEVKKAMNDLASRS